MSDQDHEDCKGLCMSRREALKLGAGGVAVGVFGLPVSAAAKSSGILAYPRKRVAQINRLEEGVPVAFTYPLEQQPNFIVKLGAPAQGGVGPNRDVVAFSSLCTHMGGNLRGRYRHDLKAIGPCPYHFSTFDLTKSGIPVHASATQLLPQIVLETAGDDIFAVGVHGLIYGFRHNLKDGTLASGAVPAGAPRTARS